MFLALSGLRHEALLSKPCGQEGRGGVYRHHLLPLFRGVTRCLYCTARMWKTGGELMEIVREITPE
jgi:hypothetical protein